MEIRLHAQLMARINEGLEFDDIMDLVFDSFRSLIPFDRISVALLENQGRDVVARWVRAVLPVRKIQPGYTAPLEGSSLQNIIDTGEPRIINDLVAYLREHPDSRSTKNMVDEGIGSNLTCPLIALGRPVGFVFFSSMQADTFRDVHVNLFLNVTKQLSITVEKGLLYQELNDRSEFKTQLLSMAAHDLRNPLSIIRGYLDCC